LFFIVFPVIAGAIIYWFGVGPNGAERAEKNGSYYRQAGDSGVTHYPI
jgi:hypothetical protein